MVNTWEYISGSTSSTFPDCRYNMETTHGRSSLFLLLLMQAALTCGAVEIKPSTNPVRAGHALVLAVSPATAVTGGSWSVGSAVILNWLGQQQGVLHPAYNGRASVDPATSALTLTSVTMADAGVYTVKSTDSALTASITVTVLEGISEVTLETNVTTLVEFRESAAFTCLAKGSSQGFLWMNGSSPIAAGNRVHLDATGSKLTILNVTRYDQGPLTCNVSNAVSTEVSPSFNLTVYYGPDHMELKGNGQNASEFLLGGDLNVSCSAQSNPSPQFQWAFQGSILNTTGPDLRLYSVSEQHSGLYACRAFNNVTQLYSDIAKSISIGSGSGQLGVSMWLLPFLYASAFLSMLSGKSIAN